MKDAPQRVGCSLTCSDILHDNGQISKLLLDFGYRHLVLKYNRNDKEADIIKSASDVVSMIRSAGADDGGGGVLTLIVNVQSEDLPPYLAKLISTVSQVCCCVMIEAPLQFLVHHLCNVNEMVKDVNKANFSSSTLVSRRQKEGNSRNNNSDDPNHQQLQQLQVSGFTPISIGFTCSSGAEDPTQVQLLQQGSVERVLDRLQTDFALPVAPYVSMVQLPDRSSNSNVQTPNTNNNYPNSIHLPNLSTRLIDLLHSRGINCLIELNTSADMMELYDREKAVWGREQEEQRRLLVANRHKVDKQVIVRTDSMFNVDETFGPASKKYHRHVFLVLIKCFLQLGAIVTVPFRGLFATTKIPLVVVPEMPPVTVVVNNNLAALTRGRDVVKSNEDEDEDATASAAADKKESKFPELEDTDTNLTAPMETLTFAKLVSTLLHPFIYRKEAASHTRIMKFLISQPDMDRYINASLAVEQVADRDEYYHNLGNTKPPPRKLQF